MRPLLVRLPNWIGDVVMALPALERLEAAGWQPILVGKGWASSLLSGHHWAVHRYPQGFRERVRMLRQLVTDSRIDAPINCLLLTNSFSSALESRMAGLRPLGHAGDARGWLLSRAVAPSEAAHEIDRFDALAARLCDAAPSPRPSEPARPRLKINDAAREEAASRLKAAGVKPPYACIVPFATGTLKGVGKAWPGFDELARRLAARMPTLVMPGPGETDQAMARFSNATLLPEVGLAAYAALLEGATIVVANDTGPGHIAAAVGAPTVSVLGPTDAARHGIRGAASIIVQAHPWPGVDDVEAAIAAMQSRDNVIS